LPWGDKLTAESIQFFSPIVIWSRPHQREDIQNKVFPAFQDYLEAWLQMVDIAQPTTNPEQISKNQEAHHRYLMWRATKVTSLFSWASILYLKTMTGILHK
jgi:hypothetical protein